jgi:hypothetical protein
MAEAERRLKSGAETSSPPKANLIGGVVLAVICWGALAYLWFGGGKGSHIAALPPGHGIGQLYVLGESVTPYVKRISHSEWSEEDWPLTVNEAWLVCDPEQLKSLVYLVVIAGEPYGVLGRWEEASLDIGGEPKRATSEVTAAPSWRGGRLNHLPVLHSLHQMCDPRYIIERALPKLR